VEIPLLSPKTRSNPRGEDGISCERDTVAGLTTPKPRIRWRPWAAATAFLVLGQLIASLTVPRGFLLTLITDVITLLLMSSAFFVFRENARTTAAKTKTFWALVATVWALILVGQILWMYFDLVARKEVPNPFAGDILLFLSNVPFLAALLLQPNLEQLVAAKEQRSLDFVLLLVWWLFLYLFYVVPWQYVTPNEARYGSNYNLLNALLTILLLSVIAFSWRYSAGGWRRVFGGFFVAQSLISLTGYWTNTAIDVHAYFPGSWYDVPYTAALAAFTVVGLIGLSAKCTPVAPKKARAVLPFAGLGMIAVLSIPVFGGLSVLAKNASPEVGRFRELVTLGTVSIMALLVFAKKQQLATQLTRTNQVLQEASMTDFLTGVRNRRFFDLIISGEAGVALRSYASSSEGRPVDLILYMADVDDFKDINDRYGHDTGDKILIEVARRIRSLIRSADVLVRWGGDEFLVIYRHSRRSDAASFALRILNALTQPIEADNHSITLNISIGWAAYPWFPERPDEVPLDAVLGLSDRALYEAKTGGKNRAVGVSPCEQGKSFVVATAVGRVSAYSVETLCLSGPPLQSKSKSVVAP
jgi:diguanylate cyclase (GGDEF)-like protein